MSKLGRSLAVARAVEVEQELISSSAMQRPVDGITYAEAEAILNRSRSWVGDRIRDGTLPRGPRGKKATLSRRAVEELALDQWLPRRHIPGGYWATSTEVAEILAVSTGRVRQLAEQGLLPGEQVRGKRWLFRRDQIVAAVLARRSLGR